jgi:hypothetical protein
MRLQKGTDSHAMRVACDQDGEDPVLKELKALWMEMTELMGQVQAVQVANVGEDGNQGSYKPRRRRRGICRNCQEQSLAKCDHGFGCGGGWTPEIGMPIERPGGPCPHGAGTVTSSDANTPADAESCVNMCGHCGKTVKHVQVCGRCWRLSYCSKPRTASGSIDRNIGTHVNCYNRFSSMRRTCIELQVWMSSEVMCMN